jgi:hypothetical protein
MVKKKEEFAGDPMMRELPEIRERHYQETRGLSPEEEIRRMRDYVRRELEGLGYKLIPAGRRGGAFSHLTSPSILTASSTS